MPALWAAHSGAAACQHAQARLLPPVVLLREPALQDQHHRDATGLGRAYRRQQQRDGAVVVALIASQFPATWRIYETDTEALGGHRHEPRQLVSARQAH